MDIFEGNLRIISRQNIYPSNISIFSIIPDVNIVFQFNINDAIHYANYYCDNKNYQHILYEILNKSLLWNISYNISQCLTFNSFDVIFKVSMNSDYINIYIDSSLALNYYIYDIFHKLPNYIDDNKSIIPNNEMYTPNNDFLVSLYDYQKKSLLKMINIENNNIDIKINYAYKLNFNDKHVLYDPVMNKCTNNELYFDVITNGGILADEMGLGKTISMIALIHSNPLVSNTNIHNNKIITKATLIICPSHLAKQWENEIKKCNPKLKILLLLTKTHHLNIKYKDFIDSDIIITSQQFIMNFKYYPTIHYPFDTSSSRLDFSHRNNYLMGFLCNCICDIGFPNIYNLELPLFEFFHFHRLILDEGHEIFGEMLISNSVSKYISNWLANINSNYYWYVSGTPFINILSVMNCARFINLKLIDTDRNLSYSYNNNISDSPITKKLLSSFINRNYLWENILDKICIRHKKSDLTNQLNLLGFEETIYWLKLTDLEKQLYDSKKNKVSNAYLQQLCCHPLIIESSRKIFGDIEVDLSLMQDKLIIFHKNNFETYKLKLERLDPTKHEYHMLKKTFETQMHESKYLFTILENMKNNDNIIENENCSICMDDIISPTLTNCGHIYCNECIKLCLSTKKMCPLCKKEISYKDLILINTPQVKQDTEDPLIIKYGSKLGKLIYLIKDLNKIDENRIIIFSQWDDMLSLIGKTLLENNITNNFVKGNVWTRTNAINKFKTSVEDKVIMLSLKNAASGTNLVEATHIFFVEPINAPLEEIKSIESQAIARACRIGQKQKVNIIRILL
jgi:DNA repair protein RAD5